MEIKTGDYKKVYENIATNDIVRNIPKKNEFDLLGTIRIQDKRTTIVIEGLNKEKIKTSTCKLLDYLMMELTEASNKEITLRIPLIDYMEIRGFTNEKEARKVILEDLKIISKIQIRFTGETGKTYLIYGMNGGTWGIKKSLIVFNFNKDFLDYLKDIPKQFMYMSKYAFIYNDKYNPYSYYLSRRLDLHKRINIEKKSENIIGVKTLLDSCPNFNAYFSYPNNSNHFTRLILEPLERDLDELYNIQWEYVGEQPKNYNELIGAKIKFTHNSYPMAQLMDFRKVKRKRAVIRKYINGK